MASMVKNISEPKNILRKFTLNHPFLKVYLIEIFDINKDLIQFI
jgi:hypothetical protein